MPGVQLPPELILLWKITVLGVVLWCCVVLLCHSEYLDVHEQAVSTLASRGHAFSGRRRPGQLPIRVLCVLQECLQPNQIADRPLRHVYAHSSAYAVTHMDAVRAIYHIYAATMSLSEYIKDATRALGITNLKVEQEEAITQFALGRDVFVALPTGY